MEDFSLEFYLFLKRGDRGGSIIMAAENSLSRTKSEAGRQATAPIQARVNVSWT